MIKKLNHMKDERKTKATLITELEELRQENQRLENSLEKSEKDLKSAIADNKSLATGTFIVTVIAIGLLFFILL